MKHIKTFEIFNPIPMWIAAGMFNPDRDKKSYKKSDTPNYTTPIQSKFTEYRIKCLEKEGFKVNRSLTEARKKIDIYTIIIKLITNNKHILIIKKNVDKILLEEEYRSFYILIKDYMKKFNEIQK